MRRKKKLYPVHILDLSSEVERKKKRGIEVKRPQFPIQLYARLNSITDISEILHERIHSTYDHTGQGFLTVHRFLIRHSIRSEYTLYGEATQKSQSQYVPPSDLLPLEVNKLYNRIRHVGARLVIRDYVTPDSLSWFREPLDPLPDRARMTETPSHAPRRANPKDATRRPLTDEERAARVKVTNIT